MPARRIAGLGARNVEARDAAVAKASATVGAVLLLACIAAPAHPIAAPTSTPSTVPGGTARSMRSVIGFDSRMIVLSAPG